MPQLTTPPKIGMSVENLSADTPKAIKNIYRTIMFLSGFWAIVLEPQFNNLSPALLHNIDKWLVVGNIGIYYVCQFFGWRQPQQGNNP